MAWPPGIDSWGPCSATQEAVLETRQQRSQLRPLGCCILHEVATRQTCVEEEGGHAASNSVNFIKCRGSIQCWPSAA